MYVDPRIIEPAIQAAPMALRLHGSALHRGGPSRETDQPGRHKAPHHPGQGLEMSTIQPIPMLA